MGVMQREVLSVLTEKWTTTFEIQHELKKLKLNIGIDAIRKSLQRLCKHKEAEKQSTGVRNECYYRRIEHE